MRFLRFQNLVWTRHVLLTVVLTASLNQIALSQNVPPVPPVPSADLGESVNMAPGNPANCQTCQTPQMCPQNPGPCQYCEPEPCCRPSWWARCKAKHQAKCLGYPEEFEELPFGCLTNGLLEQPVVRGHQARMAIYHYDFINGTEQLNQTGRRRVLRLAVMIQAGWGPIGLEESADADLDLKRRAAILQELAQHCPGVGMDSVVVGYPMGAGLNGMEGRSIYRSLMNQTGSRGVGAVSNRGGFTPTPINGSNGGTNSGFGAGTR